MCQRLWQRQLAQDKLDLRCCSKRGCAQCKLQGCALVAKRCCAGNRWSGSHLLLVRKPSAFTLSLAEEIVSCTGEFLLQHQYSSSQVAGTCLLCWRVRMYFSYSELPRGRCCLAWLGVCSQRQIFIAASQPTLSVYDSQEGSCQRAKISGDIASHLPEARCML